MQLSKHFKLEEMTKSMTATRKGIDNSPSNTTFGCISKTGTRFSSIWFMFFHSLSVRENA